MPKRQGDQKPGANQAAARPRGRPVEKPMPPPIPDTPENIAKAIIQGPPKKNWRYLRNGAPTRVS